MAHDNQDSQPNQRVREQHAGAGAAACRVFVGSDIDVRLVWFRVVWYTELNQCSILRVNGTPVAAT